MSSGQWQSTCALRRRREPRKRRCGLSWSRNLQRLSRQCTVRDAASPSPAPRTARPASLRRCAVRLPAGPGFGCCAKEWRWECGSPAQPGGRSWAARFMRLRRHSHISMHGSPRTTPVQTQKSHRLALGFGRLGARVGGSDAWVGGGRSSNPRLCWGTWVSEDWLRAPGKAACERRPGSASSAWWR
jgi:hypothetical protein